jgi:hypothetical protein
MSSRRGGRLHECRPDEWGSRRAGRLDECRSDEMGDYTNIV